LTEEIYLNANFIKDIWRNVLISIHAIFLGEDDMGGAYSMHERDEKCEQNDAKNNEGGIVLK
jgi:hypothetical protein